LAYVLFLHKNDAVVSVLSVVQQGPQRQGGHGLCVCCQCYISLHAILKKRTSVKS
jgi:hypothetical protein